MGVIFGEKDSVFFVGGRGTKAGDADAGGCTKEYWGDLKNPNKTLADVMGSNGEPISDSDSWNGSQTACDVLESTNDNGLVMLVGTSGDPFEFVEEGHVVNVKFGGVYSDGRYEVTSRNFTDEKLEIDLAYISDTTCDAKAGGAFDKLQTVLDDTAAGFPGSPHNVDILTNKDETFSGVGDQIDIDGGGGGGSSNTWKRIIGIDDSGVELAKGSYVEIDAANYFCHVFRLSNVQCIELKHIYANDAHDTVGFGFYITATGFCQGILLTDCKSTNCKYGVYSDTPYIRGLTIMGGYYSSASGTAFYFQSCRWVNVIEVELVGSSSTPLIDGGVVGTLLVDGCVLRKTATYIIGIFSSSWDTFLVIRNCVFYNIDACIVMVDPESRLVQYNNIFILHTAATGKVINRASGAIKYSDYSCAWAIDGAPAAPGCWGGTGLPEYSIEQDPQFVDADNGDFRPRNPNVLRGGKPDIADNETEMGAILQKYQFARRAKAANLGRLQIMR